ncbi:MAG: hypothetical protein JWR26_1096 [Pedosphaera sp.]|nr:hypothetical protein [Pedosphaera sp.]
MSTKATVRNKLDDSKFATVWLEVSNDPEGFRIGSLLNEEAVHEVVSPEGQAHQGRTFAAWESACYSGVFYIRKRARNDLLAVVITRIAGLLERGDSTGFAVAASAAFLGEMGLALEMSEKDLAGWKIEKVERDQAG